MVITPEESAPRQLFDFNDVSVTASVCADYS